MSDLETLELAVRGLTFDALAAGPADGELVLLLHGFPETSWAWRYVLPVLGAAGYRAVAPDQRGYSPRARPTEVEAYATDELVADALGFADALGAQRFHVVGHDWGGALAWQLGGRHGDRLRTLSVLSTPHPAAFGQVILGGDSDQAGRSSYIEVFQQPGSEALFVADDNLLLKTLYEASGMPPGEGDHYVELLGTAEAMRAALSWYRAADLASIVGMGPITTPTLYVWSTEDIALGRAAAEATAGYVEGPYRFEVLDGVSHWIPEQAAEEASRLLLEHLST